MPEMKTELYFIEKMRYKRILGTGVYFFIEKEKPYNFRFRFSFSTHTCDKQTPFFE